MNSTKIFTRLLSKLSNLKYACEDNSFQVNLLWVNNHRITKFHWSYFLKEVKTFDNMMKKILLYILRSNIQYKHQKATVSVGLYSCKKSKLHRFFLWYFLSKFSRKKIKKTTKRLKKSVYFREKHFNVNKLIFLLNKVQNLIPISERGMALAW